MTWVLIMFALSGQWGMGDTVAFEKLEGFTSKETCVSAGNELYALTEDTYRAIRFVCVEKK